MKGREGRAEGKKFTKISDIRNLMETLNFTEEQAMDALKVSAKERAQYFNILKNEMENYNEKD